MKVTRVEMDELWAYAVKKIKELRPDVGEDAIRKIFCRGYYALRARSKNEK